MCPPMASTPIDVEFASTNENLFGSLERMIRGCPLPCNVFNDVNPYDYMPSNLPDGVWYLVCSKENTSAQHGRWKTKEEACEIFSNSFIIGWRSTLEFYEGQVPHERKTDWVMQEFRITKKILFEDKKEEDSSLLCRVFLSGKRSPNHEMRQKIFSTNVPGETQSHSTQLSFEKAMDETRQGSTSRREVNDDDETRSLALMEIPISHPEDNLPETDDFFDDDYLELLDLDQPVSPSSSSDSSTLSSDEYFDPSALLRELEPKKTEGVVPENSGYKYSFSTSHTPNKVVLSPGSLINIERSKHEAEDTLKYECSMPGSATVNGVIDSKALKQEFQGQEADYGVEGPSSNSRNLTSSSHDHTTLKNGERKAIVGRMKKKLKRKYFCFMPF